jgi:hypothetical protein
MPTHLTSPYLHLSKLGTGHPTALVDAAHVHGHLSEQPVHDGLAHLDVQLPCLPLKLACRQSLQIIYVEHGETRLRRLRGLGLVLGIRSGLGLASW